MRELPEIAAQMRRWIDRSEQWLKEATESTAPAAELAGPIATAIRAALSEEAGTRGLALDDADWALLETDITLNADGLAFVADRKRTG